MSRNSTRAWLQLTLLAVGTLLLAAMAFAARSLAYFPGDIFVSHAVQANHSNWLDQVFTDVSWFGFPPQSDMLFALVVVVLFVIGARLAAAIEAVSAIGSGGWYLLLEHVVQQPRPSAELVRVVGPIQMTAFPSGHIETFVAVFGFAAYLWYRRLAPSRARILPVVVVAGLVLVMGYARIYAGHHWFSDVLAGGLLGGLWLVLVIWLYEWAHKRLAERHFAERLAVRLGVRDAEQPAGGRP